MMKKLLLAIIFAMFSTSFALQGGPTQPDYTQFQPSGQTDMVNLLSGDFSYQIPLSDIPSPYGNYPLSLSYHAGISPQQEASWVGLGWSLNPGAINRDVRGVPDDQFHGGTLGFIYQYTAIQVWSVNLGYSIGAFSVGLNFRSDGSVGFSETIGPEISGVAGVGFTIGNESVGFNASFGPYDALNASLMFSTKDGKPYATAGASIGIAGASMGAQISTGGGASARVGFGDSESSVGLTVSSDGVYASVRSGETVFRKSRNGASISVGESSTTISNSQTTGSSKSSTAGAAFILPTSIGVFSLGFNQTTYEYWMRSATSEYLYGYIYQAGSAIDVDSINNFDGIPDAEIASRTASGEPMPWKWTMKGRTLESMGKEDLSPAYDMYSVSSEGVSGTFRPFAREKHQLYKLFSNKNTDEHKSVESYSTILENDAAGWPLSDEFKRKSNNYIDSLDSTYKDYAYCIKSASPCSIYGMYKTNYRNRGNRLLFNSDSTQFEERGGMRFLFVGEGSGYYESDDVGADSTRERKNVSDKLLKRTVNNYDYALYGSKKVEPLFEENSPIGKLAGFTVTSADGSKYIFKQPVRSYLKVDYSINREKGVPVFVDRSSSKNKGFWNNLIKGLGDVVGEVWEHMKNPLKVFEDAYNFIFKKGEFERKCDPKKYKKTDDYFFSYAINMNPHATQWLLSEIRGADYIKLGNKEIGYNVKLSYTEPSLYRWRTPYARPDLQASEVPNFRSPRNSFTPEGCDSRMYHASFGVKEYVYLKSIETSTHRVEFELNTDERVDGKGWEAGAASVIPILVQTTLGLELAPNGDKGPVSETIRKYKNVMNQYSCNLDYWTQQISVKPKYIYFNTPLPEKILSALYKNNTVTIEGLENKEGIDKYKSEIDLIRLKRRIDNCNEKLDEELDFMLPDLTFGKTFTIVRNSFTKTKGKESRYGLYRLEIESDYAPIPIIYLNDSVKDSIQKIPGGELIVIGENGDLVYNPYIDWSKFIFTNTADQDSMENSMENQMRYLTKITYYRKGTDGDSTKKYKYKEYNFNYDYSLQPKTLNSYCKGRYPAGDSVEYIVNSPDSVGIDICKVDTSSKFLYGKLTLRSVTEKGCQNGKCASLPPFVFSYNSPSATSTRISSKEGWIDYFQEKDETSESAPNVLPDDYFGDFGNIDATIIASSNTIDEYGFWANTANPENHKVDQSFADYGAAAWSLNKVVDPAGGNLEVEYERDRYGAGIDYSQEKRTVEFESFGECKRDDYEITDPRYANKLCIRLGALYWREQCLGPRVAYWDTEKPEGYTANDFAYLDTMGVKKDSKAFFNLSLQLKAMVPCGMFGIGRCTRHGSVAVVGDGTILDIQSKGDKTILVVDREETDIETAAFKAALKINPGLDRINPESRYGYLWTGKELNQVKAGDLRVTKLTRHDIGLKSLTTYEYADGELAQLADSSYTTVLGNRFYGSKNSIAIPDVHLDPISRIVGFDDDDLMFVPGARITYPKVTVKNSSSDTSNYNGSTEFYYITPETGIPEEYVDPATRAVLKPFIKLNVLFVSMHPQDDFDNGRVLRFTLLDENYQKVSETDSIRIMAFPNEKTALFFYSDNILSAASLKVEMMKKGDANTTYFEKKIPLWSQNSVYPGMNVPLTKFNEMSLVVYGGDGMDAGINKVEFTWKRSQKQGFYPIMYKQVAYASESIDVVEASSDRRGEELGYIGSNPSHVHFEKTVTYHDLTAFLGQKYKTVVKRGSGDKAIIIKKDSSFFSTVIPDVLGQDDSVKYKVGRQVEKWSSEQKLKCVNGVGGDDPNGSVDNTNYCRDQQMHLYMRNSSSYTNRKDFTYIRYPVFQVGSVSYVGHDNQASETETNKLGKTEIHNHAYDPLTGSPTATLATLNIENEMVSRKLTKKIPYYSIKGNVLSDSMFLRNMLTQNYMDAIYSDTLKKGNDTTWSLVEQKQNLRSFSVSPYKLALIPNNQNNRPIVAWGTYNSKEEPKNIIDRAMIYANGDSLPSLVQYSGTEIISINQNLKVTEIKDVLGRSMATLFSNDDMFQLSIFYPATQAEVGAILPYRDTVLCLGQCSCSNSSQNLSVSNGVIQTGSGEVNLTCSAIPNAVKVVLEYRIKENGKSWETHRDTVASGSVSGLTIPPWSKLNYFRVYPEKAEAKSFIYDNYDNLIQIVAEDNTSTYYEYDPLGKLVQIRNDDGMSFKAHHREYMNGSTAPKTRGE